MESSVGWVDFSSEYRTRVKTVLDLLATQGVVDELGIGIIRDAFADYMFPGISTLQTRAKYFLIVPRILQDYEKLTDKIRCHKSLDEYLSEKEKEARIHLVKKFGKGERLGIIGVSFGTRSDQEVLRQPSSIYWNGLRTFEIIKTKLSLAEYCRKYGGHRQTLRMVLEETKEERGDDIDAADITLSPIAKLPPDVDWMSRLTIELTKAEGEFLHNKMAAAKPDSLLGQILMDDRALYEFLSLREHASFNELAELPFVTRLADHQLRRTVRLASLFWDVLFGAHIRYNCLLQERFGEASKKREFEEEWSKWKTDMQSFSWNEWDPNMMWDLVKFNDSDVRPWTKHFIEGWIDEARRLPSDTSVFDELVSRQERDNKQIRARLRPDNCDEQVSDWIGIKNLDYRLSQAWRIINDISKAETGKVGASAGF